MWFERGQVGFGLGAQAAAGGDDEVLFSAQFFENLAFILAKAGFTRDAEDFGDGLAARASISSSVSTIGKCSSPDRAIYWLDVLLARPSSVNGDWRK